MVKIYIRVRSKSFIRLRNNFTLLVLSNMLNTQSDTGVWHWSCTMRHLVKMIISESWIWCGVNCRECFMRMVLGLGSIVVKYAMFEREGHEVFETRFLARCVNGTKELYVLARSIFLWNEVGELDISSLFISICSYHSSRIVGNLSVWYWRWWHPLFYKMYF